MPLCTERFQYFFPDPVVSLWGVVRTPSIVLLSVFGQEFNFVFVLSVSYIMTVFHISLLRNHLLIKILCFKKLLSLAAGFWLK